MSKKRMNTSKPLLIDIVKDGRFYCQLRYLAPSEETSDIQEVKRRAKDLEDFIYHSKPQPLLYICQQSTSEQIICL